MASLCRYHTRMELGCQGKLATCQTGYGKLSTDPLRIAPEPFYWVLFCPAGMLWDGLPGMSDGGRPGSLHLRRLRGFRFAIISSASARRSFQNLPSRGMSSPEIRPFNSNSSSLVSRSFSCASRSNVRKYSLTLPKPLEVICRSTKFLSVSGKEIVTLGMLTPFPSVVRQKFLNMIFGVNGPSQF